MTAGRGALDPLLHEVAERVLTRGLRVAGIVQINTDRPGCARCDMNALVLPSGPTIRISQSLGPEARGCRLDADGLETAVAATQAQLSQGADLLIINKFGKQEAAGRGFRPLIADALAQGVGVLVGVNPLNLSALMDFADGLAEEVPPTTDALIGWIDASVQA
ncbi:DUF2478 domain-containing protein [Jannaschia sp. 2305UL9-9]|uniref:DUF2478 domain-containing protein n=1 Tax=Jannaschia sp. 2305UL9-9 TaxID=3121638 RepID=UPI003528A912